MGNSLESFFKHGLLSKSSTARFFLLLVIFVLSIVNISFATFVSQREDYILNLLECVFKFVTKIRATYTLYDSLEIYQ